MSGGEFTNLPPTCANGYFHGIMEAYMGEVKNISLLKQKLQNICENIPGENTENKRQNRIDCYHGIGHGIFIQLEGDTAKSINFCENLTKDEKMQSMCRTGVFMEMLRQTDFESSELKIMTFKNCEKLDVKYQGECFNQQSYLLEEFGSKKEEFMKNLKSCQTIKDDIERITCIRMFKF
jgi:hypothetical protein